MEFERLIREHAMRRDPLQHEMRVQWSDGSEHWIAIRARVLPGPPGHDDRMYGVCWDITERHLAEQRHRHDEIALTDARAREQVMAKLGRQLRTSLNSMFGFSELAADSPDVAPQVRRWLAQVRTAGSDLLSQLEQLRGDPPASAPAAAPDTPPLAVPSAAATSREQPLSVVYIEDNSLNLLLVETLLASRRDVVLHSATDGRTGIEAVKRLHPDLVLIDMQLPDLDGYQVLRQVRSDATLASSVCVVLSADDAREEIRRALAAGFADYWTKPIDIARFLGAIDALAHGQPLPHAAPSH
jgi:CheY-like chemotaxis protein